MKPPRRIKVKKVIGRYKGYKVFMTKNPVKSFAGWNPFGKRIYVSPRFVKLPKYLRRKILEHEKIESMY